MCKGIVVWTKTLSGGQEKKIEALTLKGWNNEKRKINRLLRKQKNKF